VYEPFQKARLPSVHQRLALSSHELELYERQEDLGVEFQITYYPLVHLPIAGLVRQIEVRNSSMHSRAFELIDGVPRLLPYGVTFEHNNVIPRHIEGMMGVYELDGIPLFRLRQSAADRSEIGELEGGNFYLSCRENGGPVPNAYLVDPAVVFGLPDDFSRPWAFEENSLDAIMEKRQLRQNRTPCAFAATEGILEPGAKLSLHAIIGYASEESHLRRALDAIHKEGFFSRKRQENRDLIHQIQNHALSVSKEGLLDRYFQETFLENAMRGGMPTFFDEGEDSSPFYLYARQNGDLERDYHWFTLEPTYLSQGNGHFRSICQNRRLETWFCPR
jgi:hypothetical protein